MRRGLSGDRVPAHPTRDDIDLLEGGFYVDAPAEIYAWLRAKAPGGRTATQPHVRWWHN